MSAQGLMLIGVGWLVCSPLAAVVLGRAIHIANQHKCSRVESGEGEQ